VGLFDWNGVDLETFLRASPFVHVRGDDAAARVTRQMFHDGIQPDPEAEGRLARTRWLEANRARSSFPCGVVPEPEPEPAAGEPRLNVLPMLRRAPVQVIAAVLPSDLVFLLEQDAEEVVVFGRLPREGIRGVDVVDRGGIHVPAPARETFESEQLALAVLRWSDAGVDDEERFAFRSAWMAWTAARRLLEAKQG
jgi:hypothetical protein